MIFFIMSGGLIIAKFVHKSDRDICIQALQEEYPDVPFTSVQESP